MYGFQLYRTYNNNSCPSGSGYYYGQHVISSTDTIHWTLRTIPYSNQRSQGYTVVIMITIILWFLLVVDFT